MENSPSGSAIDLYPEGSAEFISRTHEVDIKKKVAETYGLSSENLRVEYEAAFIEDGSCHFYVYDDNENCYGVATVLDESGAPTEYRCGKLPEVS